MQANSAIHASARTPAWPGQARFALGVALVWAALEFLIGTYLAQRGLGRPFVASRTGIVAGASLLALAVLAGGLGRWLRAGVRPSATQGVSIVLTAMLLWIWPTGTMDDWLVRWNTLPDNPGAGPYLALLPDYAFLAVLVLLGYWAGCAARGPVSSGASLPQASAAEVVGSAGPQPMPGWVALLATCAVAGALLLILTGPRADATRRGQVYFAVALAYYAAVWAAIRLTHVSDWKWYAPAPFIVGVAGLAYAALRPAAPAPYSHLDVIPACGLVRPLPTEMVGAGLIALLIVLRSHVQGTRPAAS